MFIRRLVTAALAAAPCLCAFGQVYAEQSLAPAEGLEDVAVMREALETVHPGYERYATREALDRSLGVVEGVAAAGTTDQALYLAISRFLPEIRCDHTKAELPAAVVAHRKANATHLPVRVGVFGERMFVFTSAHGALRRGDEIRSINDVAAGRLLNEILPLVPVDGVTDHARVDEFEFTTEFLGSALDHFMPLLYGWSDSFEIAFLRDGREMTVSVEAIDYPAYLDMVRSDERLARDFKDAVRVERVGDAAVLRIDTFVNYREPVDPFATFAEAIRPLNDAGVSHLVVDLRRNGGGSTEPAIALAAHLIAAPLELRTGDAQKVLSVPASVREHATTWDWGSVDIEGRGYETWGETGLYRSPANLIRLEPAPDAFRGRVTLLSGRGNASGSTMLIGTLQKGAGLRVVGEPTGGSVEGCTAGTILFAKLPNSGIVVRVPVKRMFTGIEPNGPGMGVVPDVLVEMTPEAVFGGRDPVLEAALGSD